jgi:DedD protein
MGLFSFLKGSSASENERTGASDPVQAARSRARRRLIGAAVLLGVGVIGFPLLFETQPRPIPVDIPIEIPRKEGAPTLPLPPPRIASAAPAVARVSSGVTTSEPARAEPASAPAAARPEPSASRSQPSPRTEAPARSDTTKTVATAEPNKSDATAKSEIPKPDAGGRFVVQVGAYGEAASARDMRQRVDKLGLKSYSQVADVDGNKRVRVRVGPFHSREDAEKVAGKLKAAGLPAAILTL